VTEVVRANPEGLLLVATNTVDALTFAALRLSGLPPAKVFGSGTVLDTARLRAELAAHYGVDARNVHAYVLGEHGDSELVAWSAASLANVPLHEYCRLTGMSCTTQDMADIAARVRDAAYEIIRRKGATNFAIAAALTRIIETVVRDQASVLTVSALHSLTLHEIALHEIALQLMPLQEIPLHGVSSHLEETEAIWLHSDCDHVVADQDVADQGMPRTSISPTISSGMPSPFTSAMTWNDPRLASREPVPADGTSPALAEAMPPTPLVAAWTALWASIKPSPAVGQR